jgi:hypothetical protein
MNKAWSLAILYTTHCEPFTLGSGEWHGLAYATLQEFGDYNQRVWNMNGNRVKWDLQLEDVGMERDCKNVCVCVYDRERERERKKERQRENMNHKNKLFEAEFQILKT